MIRPVKLKTSAALFAFSSLLCGLLISGCSSGQTEAQRLASKRFHREPYQSRDTPAEARSGSSSRMLQSSVQPASAPDVLLAQKLIRNHLHAFGSSDFHLAFNLLTPRFQQGVHSEESLRRMMEGFYSDFMHVKKVHWIGFFKDKESGDIQARLTFQASGGGITRATYFLHPQDGRYLIGGIDSYSPSQFNGGSGPRENRPNEVEERMFSGVLFSPTPQYRVLDFRSTSL
jgi:hypothetical protein